MQQVYDYWRQVVVIGGVLPAIEQGFFQQEIANAAYEYQQQIDTDQRKIVGVNGYGDVDEAPHIPILKMDPQGYDRQAARLDKLRQERDSEKVAQTLQVLRAAAEGSDNMMPAILDAVKAYATLGEITDVLREVFGTYQEETWF